MPELTLEEMGNKLISFEGKLDTFIGSVKKGNDDSEKETEKKEATALKKAEDEKKEEKKEAKRAALEAAIKKANHEEDSKKKEAAIKKAMSDYDEDKETPKTAMTDEEKEKNAQVASIITDKKIDIDNKILAAATITNPAGVVELKKELEKGTFTASVQTFKTMEKIFGKQIFQANIPQQTVTAPPPFFMAGAIVPTDVDANQLNASSNVMDFAKLSTKDLLEGKI